jgi:PAS domain S-box-containing protein
MHTDASSRPGPDRFFVVVAALLAAAIFVVDLLRPLGDAIGMAYVLVVVLGLRIQSLYYPGIAAAVATVLIMVDLARGWISPPPPSVFVNRPLMSLLVWGTAVLVVRFKRLEQHSAQHLRQLADLTYALDQAAIVATTDVSGRITYVNDNFVEISKYSRDELIGQDHRIINSKLHPKSFFRDLWHTIAAGQVWHGEIRNRAKDGTFYWVDTTIVPFLNDRGKPYQYTAIRSDITERKAAEERLRDQTALARVGQMAAVVAHEVRNPLAGIRGAVQVLMGRRPSDDPDVQVMRDMVARIDSLTELIRDLLLFARPRPPRLQAVEMRPLLLDAAGILSKDPVGAHVTLRVEGDEVAITADSELVRASLVNLFLNAAQAMNGRGAIHVNMGQDDEMCRIDMRDEGPGIPAEIRDRVFEPFFTTKVHGGGLGLAVASRTATLHGGSLTFQCPASGGTIMTMRLPVRPSVAVAEPTAKTAAAAGLDQRP